MFCKKCGKEVNNNAKFCPFCGQEVGKAITEVYSTEKTVPSASMNTQKDSSPLSFENIKKTLLIIASACIMIPMMALLVINIAGRRIDPFKQLSVYFEGANGEGVICYEYPQDYDPFSTIKDKMEQLEEQYNDIFWNCSLSEWEKAAKIANEYQKYHDLYYSIDISVSQKSGLSNEDMVTIRYTWNDEIAKELSYRLKSEKTYTVKGLKDPEEVDFFENAQAYLDFSKGPQECFYLVYSEEQPYQCKLTAIQSDYKTYAILQIDNADELKKQGYVAKDGKYSCTMDITKLGETGYFYVAVAVNIRTSPSKSSKTVRTAGNGEYMNYYDSTFNEGYIWYAINPEKTYWMAWHPDWYAVYPDYQQANLTNTY